MADYNDFIYLKERYEEINGYFVNKQVIDELNIFDNIDYIKRLEDRYSLMSIETNLLYDIIEKIFKDKGRKENLKILDLGCGDGRIEKILQYFGENKIIAVDLSRINIQKLIEEGNNTIIGIVDKIENLEFNNNEFDIIIAWGSLGYCNDNYTNLLNKINNWLRYDGIVILAEPTLESHLVYSLVRRSPEEFINIIDTKTRAASWEKMNERYRLFYEAELDKFVNKSMLQIKDIKGISLFPSLIFGGLLYDINKNNNTNLKDELIKRINGLEEKGNKFYRQKCYILGRGLK